MLLSRSDIRRSIKGVLLVRSPVDYARVCVEMRAHLLFSSLSPFSSAVEETLEEAAEVIVQAGKVAVETVEEGTVACSFAC